MKLAAVILNYNDAQGTVNAIDRIDGFLCFDRIIVVDNASPDKSADVIEEAIGDRKERIILVRAGQNGGYGYGNNLGVRIARERYGAELAVIANPDAFFEESLVREMAAVFAAEDGAAVVGAIMSEKRSGEISLQEYCLSAWKKRSLGECVLNGGPVSRRLFGKKLNYSYEYYCSDRKQIRVPAEHGDGSICRSYLEVFAVHGSFLMVRTDRFLECGGYDERMFLYGEETVLAERICRAGYQSFLLKDTYRHLGSQSITGSGLGAVRRQKLRNRSELYYYQNYLHAGGASLWLIRRFQDLVMAETFAAAKLRLL